MRNADSKNELRLRIKLEGKRSKDDAEDRAKGLQLEDEEEGTHFG
jgi:Tfp pilus assembly ATPase PilU